MNRKPVYLSSKGSWGFLKTYPDSQEALMSIIESSYDGIYITDGMANTLYINRSYEVISGLLEQDVVRHNMRDLELNGVISRSATLIALQKRGTVTIDQEFKTGKRAVVTSTPIFDNHSNIVMVVTNVRDVSELYNLKKKLEKSSEITKKYYSEIEIFRRQVLADSDLVAIDSTMLNMLKLVDRVAVLDTPVLLLGETGVGKERVAAYIHKNSRRKEAQYIKVNCGAIAENLIESELFGYEPGAFTGAGREGKLGFFGVADKGTIFLDEVGDLPPSVQIKLLRVLQEQEIVRVGANQPVKINVRILAATNRDLEQMVREGKFREDLYYRLNVFPVMIPPLRERKDDIPVLAQHTLSQLNRKYSQKKQFTKTAIARLTEYHWLGNVRELKNIIERAFIICENNEITASDLPLHSPRTMLLKGGRADGETVDLKEQMERMEMDYLDRAYKHYGNMRDAAKSLCMDTSTFGRKHKKYTEKYLYQK